MNRNLTGVYVNNNQENPFQPDINYRGYTASPLLGTPQGLSVYVDGVRQNQPFGDVVAWDLIPKIAIQDMALVPGSDPIFGLNTLGAAVTVRLKDGRSAPGTSLSIDGGSFGRRRRNLRTWRVEFERAELVRGWQLVSRETAGGFFRRLRFARLSASSAIRLERPAFRFGFSYADNNLTGNRPRHAISSKELSGGKHHPRRHLEPLAGIYSERKPTGW